MSEKTKNVRYALVGMLLLFCSAVMQAQTVSGNVKDPTGEPVIGATVMEQGTQNGTVTDFDGNFSITLKGKSNKLVISYVGMENKTVDVAGKSSVNVSMKDDAQMLDEVVAIGYGTVTKKDLTGTVGQVKAKQIENIPVANISEAMTGKLAGVNVTTTEGSPDADINIRVRGGGSLSQDNSPLYIVDGFPVSSISDISPSEIETIDVLKDASSTAIYGAQGANGVIIVTTKSGKEGNVQVNLNGSIGWKKVTKTIGVLNPYEYAYYQYETSSHAYGPYSSPIGTTELGSFSDIDNWKNYAGSDWQEELFGRTGVQKQLGLNVSGGSKEVKFNIGYQHIDEESIMRGSEYAKNNINAKLNVNLNKWLRLDFTARLAHNKIMGRSGGKDTNQSNASDNDIARAVSWRPIEGLSAISEDDDDPVYTQANPVERTDGYYKKATRFQQTYNAGLNWKPFKGWTFRTELGFYWKYNYTDEAWNADAAKGKKPYATPQALFTNMQAKQWRNSNQVTYENKKLFGGRDRINVMIGEETVSYRENTRKSFYTDFPTSFTTRNMIDFTGAGTARQGSYTELADDNTLSFFGRLNYTLKEKYLLTVTMREDGSSKFAKGNRWGFFPSVAIAWRMSDESWLKDIEWMHNLKLRLSFGSVGNNRISSGLFDTTYALSSATDKNPYFGEQSTTTMKVATDDKGKKNLYNPDLKWETTITRNFGIDYGFLKGRINGSVDFYWNTTKDLLMRAEIASNSGYNYQYRNFGKTSNKGVELSLNAAIIEKRNFVLNGNFNIAYNRNKIDELNSTASGYQTYSFGGDTPSDAEIWKIEEGGRLGEIYGYQTAGFYTVYNQETGQGDLILQNGQWMMHDGSTIELPAGYSLVPGGVKFVDQNNDQKIDAENDKVRLGNTVPSWTGGVGFDAQLKTKIGTFDASIFCNFSLGNKIINATKMQNSYFHGSTSRYNLIEEMSLAHRYTWIDPANGMNLAKGMSSSGFYDVSAGGYENETAVMARLIELNANADTYNPASVTNTVLTDKYVENASFFRIQNLTIGYTLPKHWIKPLLLTSARVYFTAYNLACFTSYSGYDPEVDMSSKTNPMCPGVDYASYPKSRSYTVGINVSF